MCDIKMKLEQHEMLIRTANACMTMIRIYQRQDDRLESIKQCALEGKRALLMAKAIEHELDAIRNEMTVELRLAA